MNLVRDVRLEFGNAEFNENLRKHGQVSQGQGNLYCLTMLSIQSRSGSSWRAISLTVVLKRLACIGWKLLLFFLLGKRISLKSPTMSQAVESGGAIDLSSARKVSLNDHWVGS